MNSLSIEDAKAIFLDSNYILLDGIFWDGITQKLDQNDISYITIGLEYFGHKDLCPLLINLNNTKNKEELWGCFGENFHLNATSSFDYMSIFQNIIKTDATVEDIKDYIVGLMIVNIRGTKKIFRFYDSRVMMYAQYFMNSNAKEFLDMGKKINKIKIDSWIINVASNYYSIEHDLILKDLKNNYTIDIFYEATQEIREAFYLNDDINLLQLIKEKVEC